MIQDINPRKYDITYRNVEAQDDDYALVFNGEQALMKHPEDKDNAGEFLTFKEFQILGIKRDLKENATYLFSIDDNKYFLVNQQEFELAALDLTGLDKDLMALQGKSIKNNKVLSWHSQTIFRTLEEMWIGFAGVTASQLNRWFLNHKFCGRCGNPLKKSKTERALTCSECGLVEYPKISPAIIVGIVDGGKLLLTRYADRPYKRYALIAGFAEAGETLEDTVRREVMEEVGLKVKDITYYKSQPWSFSDSLLVGFFARLDGDNSVTLDDGELAEGTWFSKEEIPVNKEEIALTAEMIRYFAAGNDVFK